MIARLWWKETRTLWPAWPVLFGAGAGVQWVLLASGSAWIRSGSLMTIALCWAMIYAFVAASAAFAGEREAGTLASLDALPVGRGALWLGKATFALASTLGLALIMLALGYLGSADLRDLPGKAAFIGHLGTLLFEAVAWGLLWSALLRNSMAAGVLALFCVGAVSYLASGGAKIEFVSDAVVPARFLTATLALAASAVAIVGRPRAGWSSPRSSGADVVETPARRATPIRPRPASPTGVLMWRARCEGLAVWLGASAVGWGAVGWLLLSDSATDVGLLLTTLLGLLGAALVAGVGVFGGETAAGSQRFLLHLGVGPGPIWSRTMRAWGNGLAVTALVILVPLSIRDPGMWDRLLWRGVFTQSFGPSPIPYVAAIADAFAVGTLAGMVFRRRITAGMIAVLVWLAIALFQFLPVSLGMVPPWGLLLTPIVLLGISRAWAGDWLDPRPGPARWLRLAGYVAVPSVVFPAAYIANRVWGVPDPGPVTVAAPGPAGIVPPGSDTAATYRRLAAPLRAMGRTGGIGAGTEGERTFDDSRLRELLNKNPDLFDRIDKATKMPPPRLADPLLLRGGFDPTSVDMSLVARLLGKHGGELLERGNLSDAWEDILSQYRIARQLTAAIPTTSATQAAIAIDRGATMLAFGWAAGDKQTPDLLRKALADLRALPPLPKIGEVMKAEAPIMERTLDLSGAELEVAIDGPVPRKELLDAVMDTLLFYPSWERERARRVCRVEFQRLIAASAVESRPLPDFNRSRRAELRWISPLAEKVMASNWWVSASLEHATAARRGLVQVVALRAWSLSHEGTYPETLDALVPDLLDQLPLDPYSARPFGYVQSKGVDDWIKPGQWMLFSVGPARLGSATSRVEVDGRGLRNDMVFPLP